jgi:hypothetical protein
MSAAIARHYQVLDEVIGGHGGARPVEQGEGDSVVAAFWRASDELEIGAQTAAFSLVASFERFGPHRPTQDRRHLPVPGLDGMAVAAQRGRGVRMSEPFGHGADVGPGADSRVAVNVVEPAFTPIRAASLANADLTVSGF